MNTSPPRSPLRGSLPPEGAAVALGRPGGDWAHGWNLVPLAEVPPTPWRNGGGSTRELLAWPPSDDPQDWRVRLSVAEVARDGPFSAFTGVQRWFAVLSGAGVRLQLGGMVQHLDSASAPFGFDGGAAVDCTLVDGPTQDFNLMLRGNGGRMERLHGQRADRFDAPVLIAIYAHGACTAGTFGSEMREIPAQTLAWRILEAGARLEAVGQDALWMEVVL